MVTLQERIMAGLIGLIMRPLRYWTIDMILLEKTRQDIRRTSRKALTISRDLSGGGPLRYVVFAVQFCYYS
jgi:hypothetical protein